MKYQLIQQGLVVALSLAPISSLAQTDEITYETATITTDYCVALNPETEVVEHYVIDISHLHLPSEEEAIRKFGHINNNLLTYSVDFPEDKVYLHVHLDRTYEPHNIVWWNDYVASLCGL